MESTVFKQPHVFALTGGIASGKSTVASLWRATGLPVVDADQLARAAVAPGSFALGEIVREFGAEVLTPDGTLDRPALARLVFADERARAKLNSLVHPEVQRLAQLAFAEAAQDGARLVAYEIPLLFETGQQDSFRPIVVVATEPSTQMTRAAFRDGVDPDSIAARISAQYPLEKKILGADFVIENNGTLEELQQTALRVLEEVRARC